MARYFGPYPRGSSPVAIFSGPGVVAGNMAAEAGPRTQLGQVATVAGNMAAQVGPITRLGNPNVTRLGAVRPTEGNYAAEVGPITRLGMAPVTRLGVVGDVAGRMGAEAGPVTRLGNPNLTRLGVVGDVAGRMGAEAGPVTRLNGPMATALGRSVVNSLGTPVAASFGRDVAQSLGRPTAVQLGMARAAFGRFYGFGADESAASAFTPEQIDCLAGQGEDVSSDQALVNCGLAQPQADSSWSADQWANVIKSIGGAINPIVNTLTGQLVNPTTGQPLTAQQVAAYRQYQAAQKKEGLPSWAIPAGIAAVVLVGALLYMKKK